jgi:proteic killer suppression protein
MITSFNCKDTEKVFQGNYSKKWEVSVRRKGQMKLDLIDSAMNLEDLKVPPGNRLHLLKGDLTGYQSISINMKWRIIFKWNNGNADNVQIVDYH